jgi:hypothetical protein
MNMFMSKPQDPHTQVAKGLHGVFFQKHGTHKCMFFANVDWTHDLDNWKYTTKLLFKFHKCPILWNGKLHLTITLSRI